MSFDQFGLLPEITLAVQKAGYEEPTPIQEQSIPIILKGKDILARAQTGTGKTAAFALPVLNILSNNKQQKGRRPRSLTLTPTRELAAQVGKSFETYGQGLRLRSTVIFGGVGINPQIQKLKRGVDIITGTPGRLLDLINQRYLDLSGIEILILDEADRMLDMGFIHDIRKIIRMVPVDRQTLFFSATYSKEIKELSDTILRNPVSVEIAADNQAADNVTQSIYHTSKAGKRALLIHLITTGDWQKVLVFTKTKHRANRLTQQLEKNGITAAAIHGNKSQGARTRALADFKAGKVRALVATDIAARGLDIDRLPNVVNYELPHVAEDYIHRIGRTGRAGYSGEACSIVSAEEGKLLKGIEWLLGKKIPVKSIEGLTIATPVETPPPTRQKRNHRKRNTNSSHNTKNHRNKRRNTRK